MAVFSPVKEAQTRLGPLYHKASPQVERKHSPMPFRVPCRHSGCTAYGVLAWRQRIGTQGTRRDTIGGSGQRVCGVSLSQGEAAGGRGASLASLHAFTPSTVLHSFPSTSAPGNPSFLYFTSSESVRSSASLQECSFHPFALLFILPLCILHHYLTVCCTISAPDHLRHPLPSAVVSFLLSASPSLLTTCLYAAHC